MTGERAQAYARVMQTLRVLDPGKLCADELEAVRDAVDTLVLCVSVDADRGRLAVAEVTELAIRLGCSGRWTPGHLRRFIASIYACGPPTWTAGALRRTWSIAEPSWVRADQTLALS